MTKLIDRELSAILAALRYYQRDFENEGKHLDPGFDPNGVLTMIATNAGALTPLTAEEIAELCERLHCE